MDTRVRDVWVTHHRQRLPLLLESVCFGIGNVGG